MGFVMLKVCIQGFISTPFAMILYGKSAFWANVHHVIDAEVAIPPLVTMAKVLPGGLIKTRLAAI